MRSLYCTESPEAYFEDFGRAKLAAGVARVRFDPDFAPLVLRNVYDVFLTPHGDCLGLFISQMDPNGFEVRELQGGKSNVAFSYRVVAKRADITSERLKRIAPDVALVLRGNAANAIANAPRPQGPLPRLPAGLGLPGAGGGPPGVGGGGPSGPGGR
jgi:hypothetical protein